MLRVLNAVHVRIPQAKKELQDIGEALLPPCFFFLLFRWVSVVGFHLTENRSQFIRIEVDQAKYEVLQWWYCHIVAIDPFHDLKWNRRSASPAGLTTKAETGNWLSRGFHWDHKGRFYPLRGKPQTRRRRCRCHWQPRWIGRSLNVFHSWQLCWIGAPQLRAYLKGPLGQVLQQAIVHSFRCRGA